MSKDVTITINKELRIDATKVSDLRSLRGQTYDRVIIIGKPPLKSKFSYGELIDAAKNAVFSLRGEVVLRHG